MNERIQTLAEQATDDILGVKILDKNKFAELIIKDACQQLMEWKNEPFPFDETTAVWILKQHFGVK